MLIKDHPGCILTSFCKVVLTKFNTSKEMACALRVVIVVMCVSLSSAMSLLDNVYKQDNRFSDISTQILESMKHYLEIRPSFEENLHFYAKIIDWLTPTQQSSHLGRLDLQRKSEAENNGIIFPANFTTYSKKQESKGSKSLQDGDETIEREEGEMTYYCTMFRSME
jgi:hypothetical protein